MKYWGHNSDIFFALWLLWVLNKSGISNHKPNFWVKEKRQLSAEVDLVIPFRGLVIPIEIKSGAIGKLRSLHQFMEQCPHGFAARMYGGVIEINKVKTQNGKEFKLLNLPYFLGTQIETYLEWF